jgi:hypothetical protein
MSWWHGFQFFKKNDKPKASPLIGKRPIWRPNQRYNKYKAECHLLYKGQRVKSFDSTVKAMSSNHARKLIQDGYEIEVDIVRKIK